jgi:predicted DCC family thiol-disulfide oxidoreductase YuxK
MGARGLGVDEGLAARDGTAEYVLLYDGSCRFCVGGSRRLLRWARPGSVERVSFREPGVIGPGGRFPGVSADDCEKAMQLVWIGRDGERGEREAGNQGNGESGDGTLPLPRVTAGCEALFRVLGTRWWLRWPLWIYLVPGIRQVLDWLYGFVARNRFRIAGRVGSCEHGACRR